MTDPSRRAVYGVGLQPPVRWDCGFEFHQGDRYPSLVTVVCCHVEISTRGCHSSREFLPSVVCLSVIVKPR